MDIITYKKNTGGVDHGDQNRFMGTGFAILVHFKTWYKKYFLGLSGFSFLQGFKAWNLSVNIQEIPRIGVHPK